MHCLPQATHKLRGKRNGYSIRKNTLQRPFIYDNGKGLSNTMNLYQMHFTVFMNLGPSEMRGPFNIPQPKLVCHNLNFYSYTIFFTL